MFVRLERESAALCPPNSQISPGDWQVLSRFWYPVAVEGDVKQRPLKATLLDVELVIYRLENRIAVALDLCPHRYIRLSAGRIINNRLVCAFHGLEYDATGLCTRIPAMGLGREAKLPSRYRLCTFRAEARYGLVWACLDDQSTEEIPVFERAIEVGLDRLAFGTVRDWPVAAPHQIENYLDIAHLPFVHEATLSGDKAAAVAIPRIEQTAGGMRVHARSDHVASSGISTVDYVNTVHLPFSVHTLGTISGAAPYTYEMWNIAAPTSARQCRVYTVVVTDEPTAIRESRPTLYNGDAINLEDIVVLAELARPDYPLDEKDQIHIPGDNISHEYRKKLRALGFGQA
jgi:nitrite reductase/ring-hydroxylating ferredoxin subunit